MPKIVCASCEITMRCKINEVTVIETASFGPYRVWFADLWACPNCGHEVVSGFGCKPFMEHFNNDFTDKLEAVKKDARRVVYDNEFLPGKT